MLNCHQKETLILLYGIIVIYKFLLLVTLKYCKNFFRLVSKSKNNIAQHMTSQWSYFFYLNGFDQVPSFVERVISQHLARRMLN